MLSDNIKNIRKKKGFTQETLAKSINVVRQTVSKWEKGYSVPDADMLEKLAKVLDVQVSDLLGSYTENTEHSSELEEFSSQLAALNNQLASELERKKRLRKINIIIISSLLFIVIAALILFHPFDSLFPGDSSHVVVKQVASELYSQHEINSAIEVVKNYFSAFNGCTLTFITYKGDSFSSYETEHRGVNTIVLTSNFITGNLDDNGGLNSNDTYTDWNWYLEKDENNNWKCVGYGYG